MPSKKLSDIKKSYSIITSYNSTTKQYGNLTLAQNGNNFRKSILLLVKKQIMFPETDTT